MQSDVGESVCVESLKEGGGGGVTLKCTLALTQEEPLFVCTRQASNIHETSLVEPKHDGSQFGPATKPFKKDSHKKRELYRKTSDFTA